MYDEATVPEVFDTFMFITSDQGFAAGPYPPAEAASMAQGYEDSCKAEGLPIDNVHLITFAEVVKAGLAAHVAGLAPILASATIDPRTMFNDNPEA